MIRRKVANSGHVPVQGGWTICPPGLPTKGAPAASGSGRYGKGRLSTSLGVGKCGGLGSRGNDTSLATMMSYHSLPGGGGTSNMPCDSAMAWLVLGGRKCRSAYWLNAG